MRQCVTELSAAVSSSEGLLAPGTQGVIFLLGVGAVIGFAGAVAVAQSLQVPRDANVNIFSITLDLGWGSHLLDHLVELGLSDTGLEVFEACAGSGIVDLHWFLLVPDSRATASPKVSKTQDS